MKDLHKEIIMLCLVNATICFIHMCPVFYPYIASDYYHKNNNLRMEDFYTTFFFLFLGFPLGTFLSKYIINIFGIIDSFIILGITYLLNSFILYTYTNIYEIFILYIIFGF